MDTLAKIHTEKQCPMPMTSNPCGLPWVTQTMKCHLGQLQCHFMAHTIEETPGQHHSLQVQLWFMEYIILFTTGLGTSDYESML